MKNVKISTPKHNYTNKEHDYLDGLVIPKEQIQFKGANAVILVNVLDESGNVVIDNMPISYLFDTDEPVNGNVRNGVIRIEYQYWSPLRLNWREVSIYLYNSLNLNNNSSPEAFQKAIAYHKLPEPYRRLENNKVTHFFDRDRLHEVK
jgi:hypothetical protein